MEEQPHVFCSALIRSICICANVLVSDGHLGKAVSEHNSSSRCNSQYSPWSCAIPLALILKSSMQSSTKLQTVWAHVPAARQATIASNAKSDLAMLAASTFQVTCPSRRQPGAHESTWVMQAFVSVRSRLSTILTSSGVGCKSHLINHLMTE